MSSSAYSPIEHLANALFLDHDPTQVLLFMPVIGYFDESASQKDTKVMTIAGYVSTEEKWVKFEKSWLAVMQQYNVPYLHMKEFAPCTGVFKDWKGQEDKRKAFLADLIKVAKKNVHKGFVCSIRMQDFEEVNKEFHLVEHWGNAYSLMGMAVVTAVMEWKEKHFSHARIKYIFEDGYTGNHHLRRCLQKENLPYSFTPKKEKQSGVITYLAPFQLSDFLAWENQVAFSRWHNGEYRTGTTDDPLTLLRGSWQSQVKQIPSEICAMDLGNLRGLCESKGITRRSTSSPYLVSDNHPASHA